MVLGDSVKPEDTEFAGACHVRRGADRGKRILEGARGVRAETLQDVLQGLGADVHRIYLRRQP